MQTKGDAIFEAMTEALSEEEKLQLVGFASFEVRKREARKGRNPQTGEEIEIAAQNAPVFKPGKAGKIQIVYFSSGRRPSMIRQGNYHPYQIGISFV